MDYEIEYGIFSGGTFAVPEKAFEKLIKIASAVQLRIFLFVFAKPNQSISADKLADFFRISKSEAADALGFLVSRGILRESGEKEKQEEKATAPEIIIKKAQNVVLAEKPDFNTVLRRATESSEIAELLSAAQGALGRTLSSTEQASLVFYLDHFGLPADVVLLLLGYCKKQNKQGFRYIDKIAHDWSENEINTHERALKHIEKLRKKGERERRLQSVLGIADRKLSANEVKLFARWTDEFGFSYDIISLGYDKTVDNISKLDMRYLDKVLTGWFQQGVKTKKDIERLEEERNSQEQKGSKSRKPEYHAPNRKKTATGKASGFESSLDMDEIEKNIFI